MNPTKQQCEELIDKLAKDDKNYDFIGMMRQYVMLEDWFSQCPNNEMFDEACYCAVGDPVMIGDVLERLDKGPNAIGLLERWDKCGISKSLNQIMEESGFEDFSRLEDPEGDLAEFSSKIRVTSKVLKDPKAAVLFSFLIEKFK